MLRRDPPWRVGIILMNIFIQNNYIFRNEPWKVAVSLGLWKSALVGLLDLAVIRVWIKDRSNGYGELHKNHGHRREGPSSFHCIVLDSQGRCSQYFQCFA